MSANTFQTYCRSQTSSRGTVVEDAHALCDAAGIGAGQIAERLGRMASKTPDVAVQIAFSGDTALLTSTFPTVPIGAAFSAVILDTTALDPISSIGASGSGWVALVTLRGITSLVGTVDATALTLGVSDPGYDTLGNATTVARTITGVAHMRRQYPNGASKMISTDGANVSIYVTLDDWVYSGTTIVSASIGSTFYPSCVASSAPTKTNLSTLAYPIPLFAWVTTQQESSDSTHAVEGVAFHRHAQQGQQVACIKYNVTDGTTTSSDVLVSATSTSSKVTQGNIPEVWAGTVDMSAMTQGAICTVNAKVYPWLGTVLDVAVSGTAWPTTLNLTTLRVHCDRTGAYGGGYAYVQVGAGGGTVSATPATASADPYPTITAALAALKTWNNANKSHNDHGAGIIRLKDTAGANTLHTVATAPANSPGDTWCTIEKDPASAAALSVTWSAQCAFGSLTRWRNVSIIPSVQTYNVLGPNTASAMVCLENCVVDNTANKTIVAWYNFVYLYNITLTGGQPCNFAGLNRTDYGQAIYAGVVGTTTSKLLSTLHYASLTVGCYLPADSIGWSTSTQGNHGKIAYNNRMKGAAVVNSSATTLLHGFANVQNLYEFDGAGGGTCMNTFSDGDLTTVDNYLDIHNTAVGERCSRMYNDVVATKVVSNGVIKMGTSRYSIWDNSNQKDDRFSTGAGSVGAWAYSYGVGNVGNVCLFGNVNRAATDAPHNDNADTPYMGSAWLPSSEYNLGRTALGFTKAQIMAMFTNYTAQPQASPAGGGNYVPVSGATYLKSRVPVGFSMLKKDIAGTTRRTDGTGAAGAYESA